MMKVGKLFLVDGLKVSKLCSKDLIFVLSVGGGSREKFISPGIVNAIELAKGKRYKSCWNSRQG